MSRYFIFVDTETGGVEGTHPIVQLAMKVIDTQTDRPVAAQAWALQYNPEHCDPDAIAIWERHEATWGEKVSPSRVVDEATAFLNKWKCVPRVSKKSGREYYVAQLVGHNARFDCEKIAALWKAFDIFCPATIYAPLCTLELAKWVLQANPPASFSLTALCAQYGISHPDAHDARHDVNATIELWRKLGKGLTTLRATPETPISIWQWSPSRDLWVLQHGNFAQCPSRAPQDDERYSIVRPGGEEYL